MLTEILRDAVPRRAQWPGLGVVALAVVVAFAVASTSDTLSPLVAAVVLGVAVGNVAELPATTTPGLTYATKKLLRAGVVLLGFRLAFADVVDLGAGGLTVVATTVLVTFVGTRWIGGRLGLSENLSLLVATGYSICGASAVAAMDGVVEAEEEETAYAVALVTLCGSLSILVLPLLAGPLGLAGEEFGAFVGAAVHDVAQVVATAATDGDTALEAATVVKLTRVVLLAPLVAFVALRRRAAAEATGSTAARPPLVPLFVALFGLAIVIRSSGVLGDDVLGGIRDVEKVLLSAALFGLGAGVRVARLRTLGGRPLVLGLASWVLVAVTAYAGVTLL